MVVGKNNLFYLLVFFVACYTKINAQYFPSNCNLNYTQILFKYPHVKEASFYQITIYPDTLNSEYSNANKISVIDSTSASIINDLKFGCKYKWLVKTFDANNKLIDSSKYIHFIISYCKQADTLYYKYKNNYSAATNNQLFTLDHSHCIINRKGKVVWFLPQTQHDFNTEKQIRCINLQNNGNLTVLSEKNIYEISLNGNVLWQGPNDGKVSGDSTEHYHHFFKKLNNGNYITLSQDLQKKRNYKNETRGIENGTIIEYDSLKNVVWRFSTYSQKFDSLLFVYGIKTGNPFLSSHINSIAFSNDNKFVYLSFRNISRIIKVEKKTKKIVAEYGEKLSDDDWVTECNDFKYQHDLSILKNNTILLFNNGVQKKEIPSEVIIVKENDLKPKEPLTKLASLNLKIDSLNDGKSLRAGSVTYLGESNYLVNVSNRLIEFKNDIPVWDMLLLTKNQNSKTFDAKPQYTVRAYSSLYPYFFTATTSRINNELRLTITNEGSESDSYMVTLMNLKTGKITVVVKELNISSEKTQHSKITNPLLNKGNCTLIITSKRSKQSVSIIP